MRYFIGLMWWSEGFWDEEIILDYPDGPSAIVRVLTGGGEGQAGESESEVTRRWEPEGEKTWWWKRRLERCGCWLGRRPSQVAIVVKNPPAKAGDTRVMGSIPGSGKRKCHFLLSGKSYGQRSLAGYSPWSLKESDTTEYTHTHTPRGMSQGLWAVSTSWKRQGNRFSLRPILDPSPSADPF